MGFRYYEWPQLQQAYNSTGQYMFGNDMMVAPVVDVQLVPFDIWLPPGVWCEYFTHSPAVFTGPLLLRDRLFALDDVPVFVRGGAVVPLKTMADAAALPVAPRLLQFLAFPGGDGGANGQVYEDEGEGLGYQSGAYRVMNVTQLQRANNTLALVIKPHLQGLGYPNEPTVRSYTAIFILSHRCSPDAVTVDDAPIPPSHPDSATGWWWMESHGWQQLHVAAGAKQATATVVFNVQACSQQQ